MDTKNGKNTGTILIVDDEPGIVSVCQRLLNESGYSTQTAQNAEEALAQLRTGDFDFVLTDLNLPGSTHGTGLVDIVKQEYPLTDVVVMTGAPSLDTAIPMLKKGAIDYLIKPFEGQLLLSVVDHCFERRRLSQELQREKLLRQELESANFELKKVERLKEAFLARLNHEMRTPFVSIFYEMHAIESSPAPAPTAVQNLRASISRLWDVIQNLLLFSDLNAERNSVKKVPVEINSLWKGQMEALRPLWEKKRLQLTLSMPDISPQVLGDTVLLATAFKQLFLNAIDFNKPGGQIEILIQDNGNFAELAIRDSGIGIPQNNLSDIFDGFYQVANYLTREVGGLGIGLAIVRRIIEAHGGSITVDSQEGAGTTFHIRLPKSPTLLTHGVHIHA